MVNVDQMQRVRHVVINSFSDTPHLDTTVHPFRCRESREIIHKSRVVTREPILRIYANHRQYSSGPAKRLALRSQFQHTRCRLSELQGQTEREVCRYVRAA